MSFNVGYRLMLDVV